MQTGQKTPRTILRRMFPEIGAGGFSHLDGTVEFYSRVNSLLRPTMRVVDYGAGRGEWNRDPVEFRRQLRILKGKVVEVIGADVDDIVLTNPTVDRAIVCPDLQTIPLDDGSVDVIVSDHTFEHIDRPASIAAEMSRVLAPGGWICARTPNRWGYVAVAASLVPNAHHVRALRTVQPDREPEDVFPTRYRMNTMADIDRYFPAPQFANFSYYWAGDPDYFGGSVVLARAVQAASKLAPSRVKPKLFVFLQKQESPDQ